MTVKDAGGPSGIVVAYLGVNFEGAQRKEEGKTITTPQRCAFSCLLAKSFGVADLNAVARGYLSALSVSEVGRGFHRVVLPPIVLARALRIGLHQRCVESPHRG